MQAQLGIPEPNDYDSVRGSYYPDEGAGVVAHADDEPQLIPGAIFSYTFLKDDDNTRARICDQGQAQEGPHRQDHGRDQGAARVGDLLVMAGDIRADFRTSCPSV